jgi:Molybdate transporter of MFS superfamily
MIPSCRNRSPTVWRASPGRIYDLGHTGSAAHVHLFTSSEGGKARRILDDDAGSIAGDDAGVLELREHACDKLSDGAKPGRELALGQAELDLGAGLDESTGTGFQVAGQSLGHRAEGEIADDVCEAADSLSERLQHRERHSRASLTETNYLGTLIPFVVGYITVAKMDAARVLVAFGLFKIIAGLTFKTPVPIQPMKAIGTAAISHAGTITGGAGWASGLFTGVLWLVMGLSGGVGWIAKITSRPVIQSLVLGLGLGFLLERIKLAQDDLLLAVAAVTLTFALLSRERLPAMLVLLAFGIVVAVAREPALVGELGGVSFRVRLPEFALTQIGWQDLATGVMVLGLPQAGLTLGNAIVATVEENNQVFPERPITVRVVAIDHGIMNLVGSGSSSCSSGSSWPIRWRRSSSSSRLRSSA